MEGEPSGVFDEETETALIWFQADHYLMTTGMADSVTMEILANTAMKADSYVYDVYTEEAAEYETGAVLYAPAAG